ncbi:MAG: efflux RND transporter periplasmic adaptor subunit [Acidobacteriota bacterium]
MKKWIIAVVSVLVVAAVAFGLLTRKSGQATSYRFVAVEKGDLESVVTATGTLSAVTTVQVGTQISGLISKLYVDFNDKVKKGQLVAQLDTTLLDSSVRDAEATLDRNQAQLDQATRDFGRLSELHKEGIAADADFNTAQYNLDIARANLKSAKASLDRARQNLAYATISAPVSGTVVERDVDVGQTVAASLSAPKLFLIANDLSEMQILAPVDESDIGQIKEGQTARFTVKAYPDTKFSGTVKQVRLQSTVDQNVVSYTVVVGVKNADGRLLPGMTATVEFLIASAKDVLKIPNAALRFRPSEAMLAEVRARLQRERAARPAQGQSGQEVPSGASNGTSPVNGAGGRAPGGRGNGNGGHTGAGNGARGATLLFYLDKDGKLAATPVRAGITDGQFTEVKGRGLEPGMQVIAGVTQAAQSTSSTPFQASQQGVRHGPGGF